MNAAERAERDRVAAQALAASQHLDRSRALDAVCRAVEWESPLPELIESPNGDRRLYWPSKAGRAPDLFKR